ncbi:MAG: Holliday junction branch migration protein RuvA [Lachnospiraceae bacterium]|nr:Holliday junction branch migration protein RuvA [Lachnospiraceae bacterium]
MISFVSGILEELTESSAVIDVGGVGFDVLVPAETLGRLSSSGLKSQVKLYTYMYVREDSMLLYGFLSRNELQLFRELITVSGIGPKGALSLLSSLSADDLRFAILSGDTKTIAKAPGIGKRTAERLVIDLRGKLQISSASDLGGAFAAGGAGGTGAGSEAGTMQDGAAADAAEALAALGYPRLDAVKAVKQAQGALAAEGAELDTESLLKSALTFLL